MPCAPRSGVLKASSDSTPNGIAVHSIQGRNFPHRLTVRSAAMPISGVNTKAPSRPITKMIVAAVAGGNRYTSV
ncbi:hypothetical protein D3C71_1209320 [compost metagenome]